MPLQHLQAHQQPHFDMGKQQQQQQQQQRATLDVAFLQEQMAAWQAQRAAAETAAASAADQAAPLRSAFHPVANRPLSAGGGAGGLLASISAAAAAAGGLPHLGLPHGGALAAYLAAEAAARGQQLSMPPVGLLPGDAGGGAVNGFLAPHVQAAMEAATQPVSPASSDSELSAGEILTGMKHANDGGGRAGAVPRRRQASPPAAGEPLWRTSTHSESSAGGAAPAPAPGRRHPAAVAAAAAVWPAESAPLPPADQPHIPRRSRTRAPPPPPPAAPPQSQFVPFAPSPPGAGGDGRQWSAQLLALMLTVRATAGAQQGTAP